jgi:CDP-4-dehydro-6-deoxyglucose reductase, E1
MSLNWSLASTSWSSDEYEAMQEVIQSGFFSMGAKTQEFEEDFAKWAGRKFAVMVNSGSSANLIAASALRYIRDADAIPDFKGLLGEVIVPAVSWSTTFFPFFQNRYKLVFVDVNPETFNIDVEAIEAAITSRTVGICGVNLLGLSANWSEIKRIASENGLWTLEDNCEAMGSSSSDGNSGTFGDLSTFSFFYSHHICTMEGGMIVCDDENLYVAMRSLRAHGWAREVPIEDKFLGVERSNKWNENFRFYLPGFNVRPLELSAAIGVKQLEKFEDILRVRRANAELLSTTLNKLDTNWRLQSSDIGSSWFTFGFVNTHPEFGQFFRNKLVEVFAASGVQSRPIVAGDFTKNPVFSWLDADIPFDLPGAKLINDCGLMIGNHHYDLTEQILSLPDLLLQSEHI